jgi:mRNA interferase YafQ
MFTIKNSASFSQDIKRQARRGKDIVKFMNVVLRLATGTPLPPSFRDHALAGKYAGYRDCHIDPDWVLVYAICDSELYLFRTGAHADILGE